MGPLAAARAAVLGCTLLAVGCIGTWGDQAAGAPAGASVRAQTGTARPQGDSESNSSENKTQQYTLTSERYEKAMAYSRASYRLYFVDVFLGIAAAWLILRLGIAAKLRDIAENVSANRWVQGLVFVPLLVLAIDVCAAPVSIYGHALSRRYEQSIQGWGSWFWDWTKYELLTTAFAVVVILILDAVMRRSPRRWWLYSWLAALLILVGMTVSTPVVIDPVFHNFEPLAKQNPALSASIEKLTQRAGVPVLEARIFLMDASTKTNAINAYVTGIGASKRIVIWDTMTQKLSPEETLFVVGHEMGHYILGHMLKGVLLNAALLLAALYLFFHGLHLALDRWGSEWRIYGANDWAVVAGLFLLLNIFSFLAAPVTNTLSRHWEHQADVYGLEVIHGQVPNSDEVAAHAFQRLGELDLADPNPPWFITFWLYSHPPLGERLVFAHSYDPWSKGEAPRYVK